MPSMVAASPKGRPAPETRKFDVELAVLSLANLRLDSEGETLVSVDVKWKGPKSALGSRFRKSQKKDNTSALLVTTGGTVTWEDGANKFKHLCVLSGAKGLGQEEVAYQAWDVNFVVQKVGSDPLCKAFCRLHCLRAKGSLFGS